MKRQVIWVCLSLVSLGLSSSRLAAAPPRPSPCGVAPAHGAQDVTFKSTIDYSSEVGHTDVWVSTIRVLRGHEIVDTKSDVFVTQGFIGVIGLDDPKLTIKALPPGIYTVESVLLHLPVPIVGHGDVMTQSCQYTINR
jgi:hypothetical protein